MPSAKGMLINDTRDQQVSISRYELGDLKSLIACGTLEQRSTEAATRLDALQHFPQLSENKSKIIADTMHRQHRDHKTCGESHGSLGGRTAKIHVSKAKKILESGEMQEVVA